MLRRYRQRFSLFEKRLCKVLERACDQQTCVLKVEALRHGAGEVERLCHDHLTGRMWKVKRDVIPKHTLMIIRGLSLMHMGKLGPTNDLLSSSTWPYGWHGLDALATPCSILGG